MPRGQKKKGNKQLQAKNWILTFPQCALKKEGALANIKEKWNKDELSFAIIAEEKHEDGSPHLHILLSFKEKFITRDRHVFDFIARKHGSYETVRSLKDAIRYVKKDGNFLTIGDNIPSENGNQKQSKSTAVAEMLKSGATLEQIFEAEPGYFLQNKKKIQELAFWIASYQEAKRKPGLKFPISYVGENVNTQRIVDWLNTNLSSTMSFKAKQLYIYGPSNHCKTSLVMKLSSYIPVYDIPSGEDFYDFYENDRYRLSLLDEFKAHKTIQWLNLWLQGSTLTLRTKGSQYLKRQNIPTIILSNYSLEECYAKTDINKLITLENRLEIIKLIEPIDIDNIEFEPANGQRPNIPQDLSQPQIEIEQIPDTPATPPIEENKFTTMRDDEYEEHVEERMRDIFLKPYYQPNLIDVTDSEEGEEEREMRENNFGAWWLSHLHCVDNE